jgi:hypothetical protein
MTSEFSNIKLSKFRFVFSSSPVLSFLHMSHLYLDVSKKILVSSRMTSYGNDCTDPPTVLVNSAIFLLHNIIERITSALAF